MEIDQEDENPKYVGQKRSRVEEEAESKKQGPDNPM